MTTISNGTELTSVVANGVTMKTVYANGALVFPKQMKWNGGTSDLSEGTIFDTDAIVSNNLTVYPSNGATYIGVVSYNPTTAEFSGASNAVEPIAAFQGRPELAGSGSNLQLRINTQTSGRSAYVNVPFNPFTGFPNGDYWTDYKDVAFGNLKSQGFRAIGFSLYLMERFISAGGAYSDDIALTPIIMIPA